MPDEIVVVPLGPEIVTSFELGEDSSDSVADGDIANETDKFPI